MTLTRLLLLVLLTSSSTASHPFVSQNQPTKARLDSVVNSTDLTFYDSNVTNDNSFSSLHNAALHLWRYLFPKPDRSEILWSQPQDHERKVQSTTKRSSGFDDSSRSSEETQFSKSISEQNKRIKRATSKFTGLVVGASRDNKLLQTVTAKLNTVESLIWSLQSQYTKPFIASKHEPATIVGTFSSDLRTNFHGFRSEWNLRRSTDYSLHDVNSLTTLMVLQCLVEASLFGSATAPSVSNISIAVSSLASFYTHTYSRGSSIVSLWPEKLLTGNDIWVSRSENIVGGQVKDNTTFKQLQQLAQSCKCEPAQSGLKEISQNKLCEDHFSTPLSQLFADLANPPDFLTSFSNLALGSILQFNFPGKKSGMYKAVSQMWLTANSDVQTLINKLKSTAIVFPGKVQEASVKNSTNNNTNNTSTGGKTVTHSIKRREINVNSTLDNTTSSSEEGKGSSMLIGVTYNYADDYNTIPENTTESPFLTSLDVKANGSSDSTKAAENSDSADDVPTNTTASDTPLQREYPHREDPQSNLQNTSDSHATLLSPDSNTTVTSTQPSVANTTPESNIRNKTYISTTPPSLDSNTTVTSTQLSVANTTPQNNIRNKTYISTTPPSLDSNTTVTSTQSAIANTTSSPDIALPITASPTESITTEKAIASVKVEEKVRVNQILSSESFYAIRNYLDAVLPVAKKDVILIPSLITDNENIDDKKKLLAKNDGNIWHNGRQFHSYNNVNLMTTATTLHAIVVSSMAGIVKLQDDAMLQNIVETSLQLLTWFLSNPQEVVTMATLSKFPSRYQLYWVTARVAFQLNSRQAQTSGMFQFADAAIRSFVKALRENMTFSILQSITDGGLGQDGKTRVYIDDFLGVADVDDKGHKLVSGDDRIFTSAMAINTLIATWTVQRDNGVLEFVKEIGDPVRIAINSLVNYIYGAVTDPTASNLNAFMSEQPKNCQTLPARYPANIITSPDGTELNPSKPELNHRFGVKGYISKEDYQKLLTKSTFGYTTRGGNLEDLNSPTSIFRFWSSTAYTKAVALLAIAQAANLETDTVS